ncbi:hypothetical protein [Flavobacterium chungangensis]|uniref:Uncharacterized protein n=1 Tax=Flavobacterium chungangensis TaxID=2708132 RepID=A0ABV8ZHD8_9FLAO
MKKLITLTIICIVMQSCNSQKKDLAKITFTEKHDTFFGDISNEYKENSSMIDYNFFDVYGSQSEDVLNFNGVDLSGYRNKKGGFGTNTISFEFSKKDNTLNYYHIILFYNKNIKQLINTLNNSKGKPVYVDKLLSEPKEIEPDALLWEDKENYYLLRGVTQNTSYFDAFKKNNLIIRRHKFSAGPFQYYGDYLDYLDKQNKTSKQISYYQYAKIMESEGDDYKINSYIKP